MYISHTFICPSNTLQFHEFSISFRVFPIFMEFISVFSSKACVGVAHIILAHVGLKNGRLGAEFLAPGVFVGDRFGGRRDWGEMRGKKKNFICKVQMR